jgi:predicted dithiol-disulfide oxidoreductase (DUF899 family)
MPNETLKSAAELARLNPVRFPRESTDYRRARTALLAEEIELRRMTERVAASRRGLPPGPPVVGDYRFETENGPADLADLFGDKRTLVIYAFMFGPQRERPCPMCVNQLSGWAANADDIAQHLSLVVAARSPIARLIAWKRERGWGRLRLASDLTSDYSRDYHGVLEDGSEVPSLNIFSRRDGTIRLFWAGEMTGVTADPGQDPRGETYAPVWQLLDLSPEGRPEGWYAKLAY